SLYTKNILEDQPPSFRVIHFMDSDPSKTSGRTDCWHGLRDDFLLFGC
ncbi:unnamed protein product, partial [Allacma fusca]